MNRQLIIGFLFTLPLSAAAHGGAKPKTAAAEPVTNIITAPAPAPSGSRTLKMGDNDIETIQTRPRHNTMFIFQGGENVVFAGGGDTDPLTTVNPLKSAIILYLQN